MAIDHTQPQDDSGWTGPQEDCPPWCADHYDSINDPRPQVAGDLDYVEHDEEWGAVADTGLGDNDYIYLRLSACEEDGEPTVTFIDMGTSSLGPEDITMDAKLSPVQARQLVDALNLRLAYLE